MLEVNAVFCILYAEYELHVCTLENQQPGNESTTDEPAVNGRVAHYSSKSKTNDATIIAAIDVEVVQAHFCCFRPTIAHVCSDPHVSNELETALQLDKHTCSLSCALIHKPFTVAAQSVTRCTCIHTQGS